ncbi:hypothetical protein [Archangium sp.]|uniref:hypothetical protein n=1 Tax=Archangium sp. TaxID=1872627 RepID=UPI002D58AB1F|nr:hypothetical protein [Archangium sp.]HYO52382.1 hypothetical protein [Archangium sp.]
MTLPPGWPDLSSGDEALLTPLLGCSPAQFLQVQQGVDMPRLMEALQDWSAVRLGALGPVRDDAAPLLQRKRAAFLVTATERYGPALAEVLALFVLHSAHDDEVDELLRLLARDKLLGQTLGLMPAVREELETRGLKLSKYPDRAEQAGDVLRGLGRAARDALSSTQASDGSRYMALSALRGQLPAPYQHALDEVERALVQRHFSPGNVVLGSFDALTFGVPLGFYHLVAGMSHGAYALSQGQYEQATRELAPASLLVALYAGGKGVRALSEARGAPGAATGGPRRLQSPELRLRALKEMARQLEARLGVDGLRELARDIQASREAGRFVAVGGVDAALALHQARGDVARAQAMMSKARPEATGSSAARPTSKRAGAAERPGGLASLVDERVGLTQEVVEARLAAVELDSAGPRLPKDVAVLEKQRPALDAPPPGAQGNPRWSEYGAYYENRVAELKQGKATQGPLRWEAYERMWGWFTRGLAFERLMVELLRADAALPRALRRFLGDFHNPRIEMYVGVWKPKSGLRFADVLVIEQQPPPAGQPPRVETFSFKSRNLSLLRKEALTAQLKADASEALAYYGGTLDIRRSSLQPLLREGSVVPVQRLRLIYQGGDLKPSKAGKLEAIVEDVREDFPGVEVLFQ